MLLFDAPEAASPPREDPFHCGSVCVFDLLIQDSRFYTIKTPSSPGLTNTIEEQCVVYLNDSGIVL